MSFTRKLIYSTCLLFIFLICCIPVFLWLMIPPYLNSDLFLQLIKDNGVKDFSWDVRRAGIFGTDIGSLQLGEKDREALSVKSLQINYSPKKLYHKQIQNILISGLNFHCGIKQGRFFIRGFDLNAFIEQFPPEENPPPSKEINLPLLIKKLELRNAVVFFEYEEQKFRIPLEFQITPKTPHILHAVLKISPRNQDISSILDIDLHKKTIDLKINADSLQPQRFADLSGMIPGLCLSGEMDISGETSLQFEPFNISFIRGALEFRSRGSAYNDLRLKDFQNSKDKPRPLRLDFQTENLEEWKIKLASAAMQSPVPLCISQLNANLRQTPEGVECSGDFQAELEKLKPKDETSIQVSSPLIIKENFSLEYLKTGEWSFKFKNMPGNVNLSKPCNVQVSKTGIAAGSPKIEISGQGKPDKAGIEYNLKIPKIAITAPSLKFQTPALSAKGKVSLGSSGLQQVKMNLTANNASLKIDTMTIKAPGLSLSGKIKPGKKGLNFNGALNINKGSIQNKPSLKIKNVKASFPFQWPWKKHLQKGSISAKSIKWDKFNIGSLSGFIQQSESGIAFGGDHLSQIIPGFKVNLKGETLFMTEESRTEIKFDSRYKRSTPMALGSYYPAAKGVDINGLLTMKSKLISDKSGVKMTLDTVLDNANVWMRENNIAVENIRLKFSMADLIALRSAPQQELSIGKISIGNIKMNDTHIEFQLESDKSVFIEKGSFKWCGGNVNAQALRIAPGVHDYDLILYCDRLSLAKLLMQLGTVYAEGDGAVSGRIPVRFKKGKITFNDGFLFSTPGDGGVIHVQGAEMLTQGIPKETVQYNQIELAREALKDYEYKWVRLLLNTEGENLMLRINFDGKPSKPLPFVYDEEFGGFVRSSGNQLSNFQGIRLNVNMGLPLDKILRYKGAFDSINN